MEEGNADAYGKTRWQLQLDEALQAGEVSVADSHEVNDGENLFLNANVSEARRIRDYQFKWVVVGKPEGRVEGVLSLDLFACTTSTPARKAVASLVIIPIGGRLSREDSSRYSAALTAWLDAARSSLEVVFLFSKKPIRIDIGLLPPNSYTVFLALSEFMRRHLPWCSSTCPRR